jgi:hypothetical protein
MSAKIELDAPVQNVYGWYVSVANDTSRYLHRGGGLRKSTKNGVGRLTGYFPSEEEALAAITKFQAKHEEATNMYTYEELKPRLFTDRGQRQFLQIRDFVQKTLAVAGAVRMQEASSACSGDIWEKLACVDRLVELGELREVTGNDVAGQDRVFVAVYR